MKTSTVEVFTEALRDALFDREHEIATKTQAEFYFDADILVPVFLGVEGNDVPPDEDLDLTQLFRALFSWGAISPKCRILAPHAQELLGTLENWGNSGSRRGAEEYRRLAIRSLRAAGVESELQRIKQTIEREGVARGVTGARIAKDLAALSPRVVIALEQVRLPWKARVRAIWNRHLYLDDYSSRTTPDIVASIEWKVIMQALAAARPMHDRNNLHDAAALTCLARTIRQERESAGASARIVRFCTATRPLVSVCESDPRVCELLSNPLDSHVVVREGQRSPSRITRTPAYFIVRCMFPALSVRGKPSAAKRNVLFSMQDLRELLALLEEYVQKPVGPAYGLWSQTIKGRQVGAVVDEFEHMLIARDVVKSYSIAPKARPAFLRSLAALWDFTRKAGAPYLEAVLVDVKSELDSRLTGFSDWVGSYRRILRAVELRRDELAREQPRLGSHGIPNVMRDLGLVRWGLSLAERRRHRLEGLLGELLFADRQELWSPVGQTASIVRNAESNEERVLAATILWYLELFPDIVQMIESELVVSDEDGAVPVRCEPTEELLLLRDAARIRVGVERSEKDRIIRALQDAARGMPDARRGAFLLGVGYVAFHAWLKEINKDRLLDLEVPTGDDAILDSWASVAWESGVEAERIFCGIDRPSLPWAFSLNHCVYVGSITGKKLSEYERYHRELLGLRHEGDLWHYRFADTVSYEAFLRASRLWASIRSQFGSRDVESQLATIRASIATARKSSEDATPRYGDSEIITHRLQLDSLEQEVDRVSMGARQSGGYGLGYYGN